MADNVNGTLRLNYSNKAEQNNDTGYSVKIPYMYATEANSHIQMFDDIKNKQQSIENDQLKKLKPQVMALKIIITR